MNKYKNKDKAEKALDDLIGALNDAGAKFSVPETIEVLKVYAMLAQADSTDRLTEALWGLGTSVERLENG